MSVVVGIPILKDARRFHFEKGRRWSVFEHAILEALVKRNYTIDQLHIESALPRRVIVEILIRLMRSGWVEIRNRQSSIEFQSTPIGAVTATLLELPPVTEPSKRFIGFAIELVSGCIFYSRDLTIIKDGDWERVTSGRPSIQITAPQPDRYGALNIRRLSEVLLDDDEELIRVDLNEWKPAKRLALVTVVGKKIEGLGSEISEELQKSVTDAAIKAIGKRGHTQGLSLPVSRGTIFRSSEYETRPIQFRADDIIMSGPDHSALLNEAARVSKHRIVIHSTFVDYEKAVAVLDTLKPALNRNTHLDILWGQSFEKDGLNKTRQAATKLHELIVRDGLEDRVRVHLDSTRSHSKILFFDRGEPDNFNVIVGSCNWLSTSFESVEASIRLRSNRILSDICFELAELAKPQDGQITDFCAEFIRLGRSLGRKEEASSNATAKIILGHEHGHYVLRARDEAQKSILMLSHRLGGAAKPNLIPLAVAARSRNLSPEVYFGRFNDDVDAQLANDGIFEFREAGVIIRAIQKPRVHAKVLCWDDRELLITSNNWLSADTSTGTPHRELGILISSTSAARHFRDRFEAQTKYA
ncbi:phospholipase D-like domain-containing protein [Mesorhizobium sp. NZP2077]|uniref:phospholipase D-like domain-containing protein n=1 Tax=Mesorhizobium sp. NZP2077 TaxID=2483404 RepID=UPI001557EE0B|nr:phospholipase D-like domain-containing protein [Mesorhizobium sp. NZP2077]QKC85769.1 hypothetical protein EB232_33310 [Mesorhizobium sp. NZP2077]QKD19408.1 hypothetical protein HGP13_32975 [Mesorhizobium sp. NZP2077]